MNNRELTILGLAALLMVIWAVVQSRTAHKRVELDKQINTYLIQGLEPADIAGIIARKGQDALKLVRKDKYFVVSNKDEYPAQISQINDLITKVLDIKTIELVTSNPENHSDLEVTEDKARAVVKFLDKNENLITGVLIGGRDNSGSSYVRQLSSDDVYTTSHSLWFSGSAIDYVNRELLRLGRDKILSVTVTDPNGSYTLKSAPDSDKIVLEDIPEDKQLKDDHKQVFSALTSLQFTDVMRASFAPKDMEFEHSYICRLKDSVVYTLEIAKSNDKSFVRCRAEFADQTEVMKERKVESEQELKKKEAKLLARDTAEKFNLDHKGWIYEIADYKAKNLTRSVESLLEDKEKAEQPSNET